MIPSHTSNSIESGHIEINQLSKGNGYDFSEPHRHDYYELFFFQTGGGVHHVDFVPFEILPASFQLVVPGQVHQMMRAPGSEGFVLLFSNEAVVGSPAVLDFLIDHACYAVEDKTPCCEFSSDEAVIIEQTVLDVWKNHSTMPNALIQHALIGLCLRMMHKMPKAEALSSTYGRFRRMLITNFKEMRSVSAYADQLNMTSKTLNEAVKKESGKTASDHIYNQIILEAKRLLLLGSSVKEVAFALQFDDPAHFSKFFKKNVGHSPADFRNVHT